MKPYFSHDEGARNDPKLVKVLMRLGQAGKGVYWDLVEMLYEQGGYLSLAECESYAFALRTDCDLILKLVNDFELFQTDGTQFWSETCLERMKMRDAKKEARALAGAKGGKVKAEKEAAAKALLEQDHSNASEMSSNATAMLPESLAIKRKEKKEGKPSLSDSASASSDGPGFESFWDAYGRKEGSKGKMTKQWNALPVKVREYVLTHLNAYRQFKTQNGPQYMPHPQTFLNGKYWESEGFIPPTVHLPLPAKPIGVMPADPRDLWGFNEVREPLPAYATTSGQYAGTTIS